MGVKDFTKVFDSNGEFHYKDFKNKTVVIDASVEIYRAALGMKMSETLSDAFGVPTAHINIILLGVILKLKASGADQYWVFDYHDNQIQECHNPLKQLEIQKRKDKRSAAKEKIHALKLELDKLTDDNINKENADDDLFTDDEDDILIKDQIEKLQLNKQTDQYKIDKCKADIDKQEKVSFSMKHFYIEDVKFMLNMLDIPWVECPPGYEAEQICAFATNINIFDRRIDYVLTPDADCLLFGAKQLIKRDIRKKKLFRYDRMDILDKYELTRENFIKIGLILGTDFASKTPRIGPKTVLKKYKDVQLSDEQATAYKLFTKKLSEDELSSTKQSIVNAGKLPFTDKKKYTQLLDWLELVKNFNRARIVKQFTKNHLFEEL